MLLLRSMSQFIPALYDVSLILLFGLAVYVFFKRPGLIAGRYFSLASLALCLWLATLYWFSQSPGGDSLTWIGRINFTTVLWSVLLGYLFIRELIGRSVRHVWWYFAESLILTTLTLGTGLIDAGEFVRAGEHITTIGPLFVLFALHIIIYPALILVTAVSVFREVSPRIRRQLAVIALAVGVTTALAVFTGIVLPYAFGIFAYEEIGALSIVIVALAVTYAITVEHLFDVRILVQKTLVFAILVALVEKVYSTGIEVLADALPGSSDSPIWHKTISLLTVLFIAVTFEPVKRQVEHYVDRLLFGRKRPGLSALTRTQ